MAGPRQFDWAKAKRMHAKGMTYAAIGTELGVSGTAVARVCDPHRRNLMNMYSREYQRRGVCVDCGRQCSSNPTADRQGIRTGRCRDCALIARSTSVRDDGLWCAGCRQWKWDTEFPNSRHEENRRGRHTQCRICTTEKKRQWRLRYPEKYAASLLRDNARRKAARG